MKGDRPGGWRYVVLVSGVVAVLQLGIGQTRIPGGLMEGRETERKLWEGDESDEEQSVEHRVSRLEESEGKSPIPGATDAHASQLHHFYTTRIQ